MADAHCTTVQQLSAHLDGELSPTARVELEAHLGTCPACRARLAELRAVGEALRRRFEAQAEVADFSGFTEGVLARLHAHRPPLPERLRVAFSEWRTHRSAALWGGVGLAAAALVAVLAVAPLAPDTPGEAGHPSLQAVSTDETSHVAPVVLKTEGGDAIIWLVDHPDRPSLNLGTDASVPDVPPAPKARPKGGEL
jgi:anti-sigma factor RsiW